MAAISYTLTFLVLSIFLVSLHVFHKLAKRFNQPLVLSEIVLGFLLGPSFLAILTLDGKSTVSSLSLFLEVSADEIALVVTAFLFLVQLAELFLLFEVGLEIEFETLKKAGKGSAFTAVGGIILPFLSGMLIIFLLSDLYQAFILPDGYTALDVALFFAAMLTATSIGISIRVFMDMDKIDSKAARIMIGAAVIDDILALTLLTIVLSFLEEEAAVAGTSPFDQVIVIFISIVAFFVIAIILAQVVFPKILIPYLEKQKDKNLPLVFGLAFLFFMAWLAEILHLAPIIGAVVAGIILRTNEEYANRILGQMSSFSHWIIPLFFVSVGLRVNLWSILSPEVIIIAVLIIIVAIFSKIIGSGIMAWLSRDADSRDSLLVGISMAARGEVVLVFAAVALDLAIFSIHLYSAVVLLVVFSAFVVPLALKVLFRMFEPVISSDVASEYEDIALKSEVESSSTSTP